MRVFVTGVAGQLGHDVMNELAARGYDIVGSDIQSEYAGILQLQQPLMFNWILQIRALFDGQLQR